ncbi:hypothetical protein FE257_001449 [Aspergillus nanangensis]|uniref:Acetyltransferase nanB n=2 Tax=Aspergillus nanangensis TaxID=2582783 RepID=NANB_ASPNN|nr:RecName: Full=Acetyltransferase nanB; AltName: Full=Nanangelenin A biosynthesis cluster protein B; Flags: Precursor [Aspergillus nanangensis]KAF9884564.1 hypothetical protein FE257_001449 [Aspergillus nanangensis]QIQ51362.1 hypothetical protein FE257_001449 [Aspergillus nanangensis]
MRPSTTTLSLLVFLISSILLATTGKNSIIRYTYFPILLIICHLQLTNPPVNTASNIFDGSFEGTTLLNGLQQLNILVLTGVDVNDESGSSVFRRLKSALIYPFNARGVGTKYQIKNLPVLSSFICKEKQGESGLSSFLSSARYRFAIRQLAVSAWQYLLADIGFSLLKNIPTEKRLEYYGPEEEWMPQSLDQLRVRIEATLVFWVTLKAFAEIQSKIATALLTAVGVTSPHDWPPFFGSLREAYTLRGFWGKWWHQQLRWPLTSYSNFITRRVLKLTRSPLERYLNNALVFAQSGIVHVYFNWIKGVQDGDVGCMAFYISFVAGYFLEDHVQGLWRKAFDRTSAQESSLWLLERLVGALWVATFLTIVTPWWVYPFLRLSSSLKMPYSFVDVFGFQGALTVVFMGAAALRIGLNAEP